MKKKEETAYNQLCVRCVKSCKQQVYVKLIKCPSFEAGFLQMEIPLFTRKRSRKYSADDENNHR